MSEQMTPNDALTKDISSAVEGHKKDGTISVSVDAQWTPYKKNFSLDSLKAGYNKIFNKDVVPLTDEEFSFFTQSMEKTTAMVDEKVPVSNYVRERLARIAKNNGVSTAELSNFALTEEEVRSIDNELNSNNLLQTLNGEQRLEQTNNMFVDKYMKKLASKLPKSVDEKRQ